MLRNKSKQPVWPIKKEKIEMSKSKEELDALKKEVEAVTEKCRELTPEELAQVAGGVGIKYPIFASVTTAYCAVGIENELFLPFRCRPAFFRLIQNALFSSVVHMLKKSGIGIDSFSRFRCHSKAKKVNIIYFLATKSSFFAVFVAIFDFETKIAKSVGVLRSPLVVEHTEPEQPWNSLYFQISKNGLCARLTKAYLRGPRCFNA